LCHVRVELILGNSVGSEKVERDGFESRAIGAVAGEKVREAQEHPGSGLDGVFAPSQATQMVRVLAGEDLSTGKGGGREENGQHRSDA
jgi:hypothetical protein